MVPLVAACEGTEVVTTIAGGMRLADYGHAHLRLVVHTTDLASALDVASEPPPPPAAQALGLVAQPPSPTVVPRPFCVPPPGGTDFPPGFSVL